MRAQNRLSSDPGPYEMVHLGGEAAAIVPLGELRQLQAVQRHASPELLEEADVEATLAAHREWVARRRSPSRPPCKIVQRATAFSCFARW